MAKQTSGPRQHRRAKPKAAASIPAAAEREQGTVRRVLLLLSSLVDHQGQSARALADRLNLPRSTVHRLLAMLRDDGFADQDDGGFGPGAELFRLAGRLAANMPYRKLVEPYLQALSEEFEETSVLTLLLREQLKMYYAATRSPPDPMRYNIHVGALESLVWGATGRVLLAFLTESEIAAAIGRREVSPARRLLPDASEVRKSLAQIRRDGYCITHGHRSLNTVGVAAPFFGSEGRVIGCVGFLIPEFRWTSARQRPVVKALTGAAAKISYQLGAGTQPPERVDQ